MSAGKRKEGKGVLFNVGDQTSNGCLVTFLGNLQLPQHSPLSHAIDSSMSHDDGVIHIHGGVCFCPGVFLYLQQQRFMTGNWSLSFFLQNSTELSC